MVVPPGRTMYKCAVADATVEMLKNVPLFSGLDRRELDEIAATMRERQVAAALSRLAGAPRPSASPAPLTAPSGDGAAVSGVSATQARG